MPHHARNHNQHRRRICIICMRRGDTRITDIVLDRIHIYIKGLEKYDPNNPRYPNAICASCRSLLAKVANGKKHPSVLPVAIDYEVAIKYFLEFSTKCMCYICQNSRTTFPYHRKSMTMPVRGKGNPNCVKDMLRNNKDNSKSIDNPIDDPQPCSSTAVFHDINQKPYLTNKDVKELRVTAGLTRRQTKKCTQIIRAKLGKKTIEPNVDLGLSSEKEVFKDHFHYQSVNMDIKENKENRTVILCHNVDDILWEIIKQRELDPHKHLVKIGIDGGQGFLKICMVVNYLNLKEPKSPHIKFDSVKKIFLLALAENVKESYDNLKILLRPMELHNFKLYCAVDFKVASLLLGIQCASATYPCIYCELNRNKFGYMPDTTNQELNVKEEIYTESKFNFSSLME